ncbi:FAD-dependent monooxygenase [bacterium]|nr:FAD-dependent monooxygenase [bacterium]
MSALHPAPTGTHAVVVGGSVAGLLAARALADHFDRVTVLDRDRLPNGPDPRKGTPQARHIHVLLTAGRRVLERLFPGLVQDLVAAGAEDYDAIADLEWISPVGPGVRFPSNTRLLGATRDLIEWGVRSRVAARPNVRVRSGVDVTGYRLDPAGRRVVGVTVEDRMGEWTVADALGADLVVDAAGRGSRTPQFLAALGFPRPRETVVNGFLGYASRVVRPPARWAADWKTFHVQCAPPARRRGGVIAAVEGGRWAVTLAGGGTDYPPTDEEGFRDFARSLADPRFAEAYEAAVPLTPIVGTKSTENRVHHYEEMARRPEGLLVTGDAACAFNPVYGQGMSAAAVGAEVLAGCLRKMWPGAAGLAARFQKRLARANSRPWLLATGEDYRYTEAEGPPPGRLVRLAHRYIDRITALAARDPRVRRRFTEVIHLVRPPASLFTPALAARALFARGRVAPSPIRSAP